MVGQTLEYVKVLGGRYQFLTDEINNTNKKLPGLLEIAHDLPVKILNINCKGKFIYWELENEWFLWNTLGMTGEWSKAQGKHCTALFDLGSQIIYFNDTRHFGTLKFVKSRELLNKKLNSIGPDMLSNPPGLENFKKIILNRGNKSLAESLMDQRIISGVGNYVKAESLYKAKLSPWRRSGSLLDAEIKNLYRSIIQTLEESYFHGGTTLRDYKDVNGKIGNYYSQLKVYGRDKTLEGLEIKKETTPDKRVTWWVPNIQV